MSNKMEFSVSRAEDIVSQLEKSSREMETIQKDLTDSIGKTTDWWVGDAGDAFISQYEEFKPSLVELEELILSLSTQMKEISDVMVKYDQEGAKRYK